MKERITFTIDKDLVNKLDTLIDKKSIKSRSHALELMLLKAFGHHRPKYGMILAGGKGTRLKPITHEIPKPLVPIQGKPILWYNINLLKIHDIKDIIISIGFKGQDIIDYFGDGSKFGVNITYIKEEKPLGTAGSLKLAAHLLNESFVFMNGDELKDINLFEMFKHHKKNKAGATIALTTVDDPSKFGVAKLEGEKIMAFIEKPKGEAPTNLINAGLYILEPEVIKLVNGPCSIEKDVFPKLAKQGSLYGYPFSGQWFPTDTLEKYEKAIHEWKGFQR